MSLLQTTAEEEKQSEYRSAPPNATSTEEASPTSATAASLDDISIAARQVRPDELMAALAAIDARKNATVAGTIPLGNALERMQADATPEEVWLEVYAGRLQQRKSGGQLHSVDTLQRRKRFWATGGALAGVFAVAVLLRLVVGDVRSQTGTPQYTNFPQTSVPTVPKLPFRPQMTVMDPFQHRSPYSISLTQLLSENRMLRLDLNYIAGLKTVLQGNSYLLPLPLSKRSQVYIDPNQGTHGDWITYFHGDRMYIRGWIEAKPGLDKARMLAQKIRIYNHSTNPDLAGKPTEQITVLVDGIHDFSASSDGMNHVLNTRITHLDGEAWKPWEEPPLPDFAGGSSSRSGPEL